jgi:hypothetical protein
MKDFYLYPILRIFEEDEDIIIQKVEDDKLSKY